MPRTLVQRHAGWVQILTLLYTLLCDVVLSSVSWGGRPYWSCTEESCEALRTVLGTQIPHGVIYGE